MTPLWLKRIYPVWCALIWRPMPTATRSWLCSWDSARAGVLVRSSMSSAYSSSIIVYAEYLLLLSFVSLKQFSFFLYTMLYYFEYLSIQCHVILKVSYTMLCFLSRLHIHFCVDLRVYIFDVTRNWAVYRYANDTLANKTFLHHHSVCAYNFEMSSISFQTFFVQAFKFVIDSRKFSISLLYTWWDDWRMLMISGSNEQLQQKFEYTILKPDCHSWWVSKMQSGRGYTLEEGYAIKFCFKLGKKATETYGMLQTAFRPSCMNRALVFEWHKRFKEGMESVRDDERCVRSKKVRTQELIGQIKNFMDKDRRVPIETIRANFDVTVGIVHTIIREELKMQKIYAKFVQRVFREDQKERRCHDQDGHQDSSLPSV